MVTLSPQGRAVAAIVLAFTLLTGSLNRVVYSVVGIFGDSFPDGRGGIFLFTVLMAALAAVVLLFAQSVAKAEGWAGALAQGAVVLTLVSVLIIAVNFLAGMVQGEEGFAAGYFGGFYGLGSVFGGDF